MPFCKHRSGRTKGAVSDVVMTAVEKHFCQMKREDDIAVVLGVLQKVITVHHQANEDMFKER